MSVFDAARRYLSNHPEEFGRAVRSAFGLRVGVPLPALRYLGAELEKQGKVSDLKIDAVPPGIRVSGDADLMHTPVRAGAVVYVERLSITGEEMKLTIRLEDVSLKLNGDSQSPVAALLKSGALDVSRPGDLAAGMPLPPVVAEARDNRITLDFMRDPKLARNELVRALLSLVTSFVTLRSVETDDNHLDIGFRALPQGVFGAASAVREHLVTPALGRLLPRPR
ncbi:MAG: hypothetical protein ACOCXM_02350 [Myxococcota bacterium]